MLFEGNDHALNGNAGKGGMRWWQGAIVSCMSVSVRDGCP